jgi:hypothetical protein
MNWVDEGHDTFVGHMLSVLTAVSSQLRWALGNGVWVFGVQSYADVLRTVKRHTLDGVADQIVAPTLIMEGEHDTMLKGQPERVEKALTSAKTTRSP